jgi:cell wall-associated NlpC family hydrolase
MSLKTRDIVFLLVGIVCIFAALTGDPPAKFVTASLKGKKPGYKQIQFPQISLGSLGKASNGDTTANTGFVSNAGGAAGQAISFALAQVGKPYKWGATGPNSFDCSGLTQAAFKSAGISLPRTTYLQAAIGKSVSKANLIPGDLVFPDPGHVQIYLGNGKVVESPHTGANVRVTNMWGFWIARRVTGGVISV